MKGLVQARLVFSKEIGGKNAPRRALNVVDPLGAGLYRTKASTKSTGLRSRPGSADTLMNSVQSQLMSAVTTAAASVCTIVRWPPSPPNRVLPRPRCSQPSGPSVKATRPSTKPLTVTESDNTKATAFCDAMVKAPTMARRVNGLRKRMRLKKPAELVDRR